MKIYIYLLIFFMPYLLISCVTTAKYSSIFNNKDSKDIIIKEINNNKLYQEEVILRNNFRIILKKSSIPHIKISLYLKNPPLYQTPITSGVEKILLIYIKNIILEKTKDITKDLTCDIYSNKDLSALSFSFDKKYLKDILKIITANLKTSNFNNKEINNIKDDCFKEFQTKMNDLTTILDYKLERHIFKTSSVQNRFDGNLISLKKIDTDDIVKYYKENFNTQRLVMIINGDIEKKDFKIEDFKILENSIYTSLKEEKIYNRFTTNSFMNEPMFYEGNINKFSIFKSLYKAPSFLNDEYFAYYIANLIFGENLYKNTLLRENPILSTEMINITNYGKISFKVSNENIVSTLLSFKKILQKSKENLGLFYYYGDNSFDVVKDYKLQNDQKIINKSLSIILDDYKKKVYESFNFSDINSNEKEIRFMSVYFLLNQIVSQESIKERINAISEKDIGKVYEKYFINFSWGVLSDKKNISNLSKDFFY